MDVVGCNDFVWCDGCQFDICGDVFVLDVVFGDVDELVVGIVYGFCFEVLDVSVGDVLVLIVLVE